MWMEKGKRTRLIRAAALFLSFWVAAIAMLPTPATAAASFSRPYINAKSTKALGKKGIKVTLPIFLYHNVCKDSESASVSQNTITRKQFEGEMKLLLSLGYQTVSFDQLIAFVEKGTALPKKPVCITFDDGYLSNYEIVFPILKKYKLKATIFAVGATVGAKTYKDTGVPIVPHFSYAQAKAMSDSGLVSIQTHTFDMHQWEEQEKGDKVRKNVLKLESETEEEYEEALRADLEQAKTEIESAVKKPVKVLSYPAGAYDERSRRIVKDCGIKATVSIEHGKTTLIRGIPKTLEEMRRYYVTPQTSNKQFCDWLS